MKQQIKETLLRQRIVAVLRLQDLSKAAELSLALSAAGINIQEFTLSNPQAPQAIAAARANNVDGCYIGAGSVRTLDECRTVHDAGAEFIVCPVLSIPVLHYCLKHELLCLPGVMTPTEINNAVIVGAELLKIFPAHHLGPNYLNDVLAPMPTLKLVPTGGITLDNMSPYLQAGACAVGIGSALIHQQSLDRGNWQGVTAHAEQFVEVAKGLNP